MTLKHTVKQKKKDLWRLIKKETKKADITSLMITCRYCLYIGLKSDDEKYKKYLSSLSIDQKEICKQAYELGTQFGPLERSYAKEQLIDNWLTKKIFK